MLDLVSKIDPKHLLSKFQQQGIDCLHIDFDNVDKLRQLVPFLIGSKVDLIPGLPRQIPQGFKGNQVVFCQMQGLNQVRQYSPNDQVITVEGGVTFAQLDSMLAKNNLWCPIQVSNVNTTMAAIIDVGRGGCLDYGWGGPRNLVLGIEVVLATGALSKCGGRVVKNVSGYNLQKLFVGSRSTLCITTAIDLRLYARPKHSLSLIWEGNDILNVCDQLSGIPMSCMELVNEKLMTSIEPSVNASKNRQYLCIQIHGDEEQITKRAHLLKQVLHKFELVKTTESSELWSNLADDSEKHQIYSLEISVELKKLRVLCEELLHFQDLAWQVRYHQGRIKVSSASLEQLNDLIKQLREMARRNTMAIILSYQDSLYEYKVEWLPEESNQLRKLKDAIKSNYDPTGSLNPWVSL